MGKSNFFVTAAGLNLGLLAISALGYWFTQNRGEQSSDTVDDDSSAPRPSTAENVSRTADSNSVCGVCFREVELNQPITTLPCGHKVHGYCYTLMEKDHLVCGTCAVESA